MSSNRGFRPDWPAPPRVEAFVSYRTGGCSRTPYESNNLGDHVGDDPIRVHGNRESLCRELNIPDPCWLRQVHGTTIVEADEGRQNPEADASFSRSPGRTCVVLTADCLPLLLCDRRGSQVAAVHCGWRGLAAGIIPVTLSRFDSSPKDLLAFMGPAISVRNYEVGAEVRHELAESTGIDPSHFSRPAAREGHSMVDLYAVARSQLHSAGLSDIHGGSRCTFDEADHFYSYRRDGITGRMASFIWLK